MILVACMDRAKLGGEAHDTRGATARSLDWNSGRDFAVPIVLTLSHATVSMNGVGNLTCYGTGGIQKACVRRSGDLLSMNERAHAVTHQARK